MLLVPFKVSFWRLRCAQIESTASTITDKKQMVDAADDMLTNVKYEAGSSKEEVHIQVKGSESDLR